MKEAVQIRLAWLAGLLKECQFCEGITRLHLMSFLLYQSVKGEGGFEFYEDWAPGKFGPHSNTLADDLRQATGTLIGKWKVKNQFGYLVERVGLLDGGEKAAANILGLNSTVATKLKEIAMIYSRASLKKLMSDVYYQFPQYTLKSAMKSSLVGDAEVLDSNLEKLYDEERD